SFSATCSADLRHLHSFPTRRSSDLTAVERRFVTHFVELVDRAPHTLGPFTLTPFPVVHASGAPPFALRLACEGKVIAYSGDTERSEEHTSELQSRFDLVCRLLLEKK